MNDISTILLSLLLDEDTKIWLIVSFVVALLGCFVVYFVFVNKNDKPKNAFLVWLKDFLRFDYMAIELILKISYIFVAVFITLGSFAIIGTSFLSFLYVLILGNLMARFSYELVMVLLKIWKNTTEINKHLK